jgi:hypothetical protein
MDTDFEKLGVFYLGHKWNADSKATTDELLLYDSKDLVTHAVCIGMTGSGKTGLCLDLLEEAAIDSIPTIAIDVKGDISNVLLDNPKADALQKQRIARMRGASEFTVYTPGSSAGRPVSVLKSVAAPPPAVLEDADAFRERISSAVTSILVLLGIDADPMQSREHILLSNIIKTAWQQGNSIEIDELIRLIQKPPVTRIGAIDIESMFPAKERFELAMRLNNLVASPGFEAWMEGEPLEIDAMLYGGEGKARTSIFYIAHLGDTERMFFVTTLLSRVVAWMRMQSGTPSLRAIVYMDEIFGFFPPVANPPSKQPLLTLLKQARAYGLGILLATQNPVDLDYKGLANTGTWFIGRLQTERDKARILDGLEGAAASTGTSFQRADIDRMLSGLGSRVFLMNNIHDDGPQLFKTRDALSELVGPMTLKQIKELKQKAGITTSSIATARRDETTEASLIRGAEPTTPKSTSAPLLPPEIKTCYLPVRSASPQGASLTYLPRVLAIGNVKFADTKSGVDTTLQYAMLATISGDLAGVDWQKAQPAKVWQEDLLEQPEAGAAFGELPSAMSNGKSYAAWNKEFATWLYAAKTVKVYRADLTGEYSKPRENERDFRIRIAQVAREKRDQAKAELEQKYAPKLAALQEREIRAQQTLHREQAEAQQQQLHTAVNIGATVLGAFMGRRRVSVGAIGRASTAARSISRQAKEQQDVQHANDNLERVQEQLAELNRKFAEEMSALEGKYDPANLQLSEIVIAPKKANISVPLLSLAWAPFWRLQTGELRPAWIRDNGGQ